MSMTMPHFHRPAPRPRARVSARGTALAIAMLAMLATLAALPAHAAVAQASDSARLEAARSQPIASGDRLILKVWREPTFSDSLSVDAAGEVVVPRVGRVRAAGLTPAALRDTVRARLAVYLREPVVDLIVLRRVTVLGAVMKPNVLYVEPVTSLSDLIAQAGGIAEDGHPDRIDIVRDGVRTRLGPWSEVSTESGLVRSGDQLVVGRRGWFARNALAVVSSAAVAVSVLVSAFR